MSETRTPTFRVEFSRVVNISAGRVVYHTPTCWDTKRSGRPNDERLAKFIEALEASTLAGGVNEHLGVTRVGSAKVVRQSTDEVVATYAPALFQVA